MITFQILIGLCLFIYIVGDLIDGFYVRSILRKSNEIDKEFIRMFKNHSKDIQESIDRIEDLSDRLARIEKWADNDPELSAIMNDEADDVAEYWGSEEV